MKKTALLITFLLAFFNFNAWAGPNGYLFIIGGGDWPDGMMNRYLEIAQKFGTGKIIIFPMASSVPDETSAEEAADFKKLGVKEIEIHNLTREQAMQPDSAKILDGVGGIFFSGGDQARLMGVLLDTPIYKRLHELFYKGCIIAGTSAGAAAMSEVMITGEEVRKVEEGHEFETLQTSNVITVPGLGFVKNAIVDQHFVIRKRYNRLMSLLAEHPKLMGIAIDESTAILVKPDETFEVIGASQVMVFDPAQARFHILPSQKIGFTNMVLHALTAGNVFDMKSRKVKNP